MTSKTTRAFVFPGQGSQHIGMGKALADAYPEAKQVFEEVDDTLKQSLSHLIFAGSAEELTLTENAQPALMAVSVAAARVLEKQYGSLAEHGAFVAGHSLGEYSALCVAGSLSLADTAHLLRIRGNAMQAAVPEGKGGMAALLGVDIELAETLAQKAASNGACQVANDNGGKQVVISGTMKAIDAALVIAPEHGIKRAVKLPVSAPFHSALMAPAATAMEYALADTTIVSPAIPVVANVTAQAETDADIIRSLLVKQVTAMVRWRESMLYLIEQGVTDIVEIGAGNVLSGLMKRIDKSINASAINAPEEIQSFTPSA